MTTAPHTPGPWKLSHSGYANAPFVLYVGELDPNYDRRYPLQGVDWIAEIRDDESPDHSRFESNARLMVAAPELLEALEELLPYLPDRNDALNYAATNDGRVGTIHLAVSKAYAVIQKARGGR